MGYTFYSEVGVPGQKPIVWYHFKVPGDRGRVQLELWSTPRRTETREILPGSMPLWSIEL